MRDMWSDVMGFVSVFCVNVIVMLVQTTVRSAWK